MQGDSQETDNKSVQSSIPTRKWYQSPLWQNERDSVTAFITNNVSIKSLDFEDPLSFPKSVDIVFKYMIISDPRYQNFLQPNPQCDETRLDNIKRVIANILDLKDHQWKTETSPGKFS